MTDAELTQMNAQASLIGEALHDACRHEIKQHPDVPVLIAIQSLCDLAAAQAKMNGMPLSEVLERFANVYNVTQPPEHQTS